MLKKKIIKAIEGISQQPYFRNNPCVYLYDLENVTTKAELLKKYLPKNVRVYYAMKANPHHEILKHIKSIGLFSGVEIASSGELLKAGKYFPTNKVIFTGPGKTSRELAHSIRSNIRLINLESLVEAHRIQEVSKKQGNKKIDVLVRVNTNYFLEDSITHMAGESTKMGIDEEGIEASLDHLKEYCPNLNVMGVHTFSASGVMNSKSLGEYVEYVFNFVHNLERKTNQKFDIVDFGGGLGIDYTGQDRKFNVIDFSKRLSKLEKEYHFDDRELILELGRFIVGECGYYITEIIDIKTSKGKKHIIASGGVNHLRLPSATDINHPVYVLPNHRSQFYPNQPFVRKEVVDIGGPLCFSEDRLGKDVYVENANVGDLLVVSQAGAYGYTVSSLELLSHPRPKQIIIGGKK